MAHLSFSPPKNADQFTPVSESYVRTTKDGNLKVVNFLLGSQYNIKQDGEILITSEGNITNDSLKAINGKLEIAAESQDATEVIKIGTFSSFMYWFPGVKLLGQSEIQNTTAVTERIRYEFEDLGTGDKITIDLESGSSNAEFKVRETVDGSESTVVTHNLAGGVTSIQWEVDFKEDGTTKIFVKEPSGTKTRIFNGDLNADIAETKVSVRNITTKQSTITVKTDYLFILYPNIFIGYDAPLADRLSGRIRMWDDMNDPNEANWIEVFSGDHKFTGLRVIENGIIRIKFKVDPEMEIFGWNTTSGAWQSIGSVKPMNSNKNLATVLHNIVIERFNKVYCRVIAKYGLVDHTVDIRRGWPSVRIVSNSNKIRVNTTKRRFALSVDNPDTEILNFNQKTSDDANRGNPLNLSPTDNPFIFVTGTDIDKGLDKIDDNWFSWYNENSSNDMVGFLGTAARPTSLEITATTPTELSDIEWGFTENPTVVCIGVLESDPTSIINGIPKPFHIGSIDEYIKWRSNEGIYGFNQQQLPRKKT